jgi:low affinity Fe/Cu permease
MATGPVAPSPSAREGDLTWRDRFDRIASRVTMAVGSPIAVIAAVVIVFVWLATGPIFNFSDTWQLIINTSTTIVTFWMVFVIQASANRDNRALHLKLDEVIRAMAKARNEFIATESATEAEFEVRESELRAIAEGEANGRQQSRPGGGTERRMTTDRRGSKSDAGSGVKPATLTRARSGTSSTDRGE